MNGHPYSSLTPDAVLDALESAGVRGDGRLLGLNSYENAQVGTRPSYARGTGPSSTATGDGAPSSIVVAKFYRPARWTDAQILEEHAFALELAEREIPVVAPLVLVGKTLHESEGFRFAVYPRRGGRMPELDNPETLEWIGRFIGRIHAVGAVKPFADRPALDLASFGVESRDWLLAHDFIPADLLAAWKSVVDLALDGVRRCYDRAGDVRSIRLPRRLPLRERAVDSDRELRADRISSTSTTRAWARRCRISGC